MILFFLRTALIRTIHTLQAEEGKLFRKPAFLKATQILFQIYVKVMDLFSITTLIRITHILLQGDPQQQTHRAATHIKLVHWNAQGAIKKTSTIKKSIIQDDLGIVMIQDIRYKSRLDDLPNLRSFDREGTLRQIYQRVRELQNAALCERASTVFQLPEVRSPCQDMQVGNPDLQILHRKTSLPPMQGQQATDIQMCKLRTGARHKSSLPKENGSREESKDRTSVTTKHTKTGQQETSSHTTVKRMDHINRKGSGDTAPFMPTINSHNHTRNHQANNGIMYKTIKANSKELNTKNHAEQKVRISKGGSRPTTIHQSMYKAVRTINEGISYSYVSEQAKTVPSIQSMPTNQQATNTTPTNRGRTNGRCTRNNTHCT